MEGIGLTAFMMGAGLTVSKKRVKLSRLFERS